MCLGQGESVSPLSCVALGKGSPYLQVSIFTTYKMKWVVILATSRLLQGTNEIIHIKAFRTMPGKKQVFNKCYLLL